jgi:hypothetical protein
VLFIALTNRGVARLPNGVQLGDGIPAIVTVLLFGNIPAVLGLVEMQSFLVAVMETVTPTTMPAASTHVPVSTLPTSGFISDGIPTKPN